jgi:pyridoxal phosphate enzyme (YggS family)
MNFSYLDRNVGEIKERIANAARTAGRDPASVTLMAAIKSADAEEINYIHRHLGIRDVGENRVQQLLERWDKLEERDELRMHFIGSLQTNKVKYIIDKVYMIHSLDSHRLAAEIDKQAKKHGIVANVLVEINSGNEESKGGIEPSEAEEFCLSLSQYDSIRLCGFMTMAPRCQRAEEYYGYFNRTRELAEQIWHNALGREDEPILSMGMSESYCEAIECGATLVRVGRCMFAKEG